MNIEAIITDFDEHQRALAMSRSTMELERAQLRTFLAFLEGEGIGSLTDVDTKLMLRFQVHLATVRTVKGVCYHPRTQNLHISTARKLFRYLRRKGEVFVDPTAGMELAKVPRTLPRNILSVEEMEKLLEQPDARKPSGIRDRAMLEVLYSTGMRQGELRHLDLADLATDDRTIMVRDGKGGKDRVVPCGKVAWQWLARWLKERPNLLVDEAVQAVFLNQYGGRYSKQGILMMVKRHVQGARIRKAITPHSIRHTCATHMADSGCDIRLIQELLGHSSPSTTAVYISVSIRRLKEAHQAFHPRERAGQKPGARVA